MPFLFVSIPLLAVILWLCAIRPYCIRHGKGYTPGVNPGVTFWVNWQEAGEIARERGDTAMIRICRLVFWLQVVYGLMLLFLIIYPVVRDS